MLPPNASCAKSGRSKEVKNDSEAKSDESFESSLTLSERTIHQSVVGSRHKSITADESTSSDDDKSERDRHDSDSIGSLNSEPDDDDARLGNISMSQSRKGKQSITYRRNSNINQLRRVSRAFLPFWVYRMYDSYCLAQRAAGTLTLVSSSLTGLQVL